MNHLFKKGVALLLLSTVLVAADFTPAGNKVKAGSVWDLIGDLICPPEKKVCKQGVCVKAACISFRTDCSGSGTCKQKEQAQ